MPFDGEQGARHVQWWVLGCWVRPATRYPTIRVIPDFPDAASSGQAMLHRHAMGMEPLIHPASMHAESSEPFQGNTVRSALGLQQNGVLDRLLAVVVSIKRCYSGEAFVRLKVGGLKAACKLARWCSAVWHTTVRSTGSSCCCAKAAQQGKATCSTPLPQAAWQKCW